VEDREVLEAFVGGGAVHAFGPKLHIEGDTLAFDGWWKAAFRVANDTFAVREDPVPDQSTALDGLTECLRSHGLHPVGADPSLLVAITYTALDLGAVDWAVWSTSQATAEADLAARAGIDSFFDDAAGAVRSPSVHEAQRGGARRTAGLAPLVVVAVGADKSALDAMAGALGNCRIEARTFGQTDPEECVSLLPDLTFVDATSATGVTFAIGLRATARGASLPMVAVCDDRTWTPADVTVSPDETPEEWAAHILRLLP
jgi:hypothetical protein